MLLAAKAVPIATISAPTSSNSFFLSMASILPFDPPASFGQNG
jgi:hypothetical protein